MAMTEPDHPTKAADVPPVVDKRPAKKKESWFEVVKTIVYALLIAGFIRSFLFQPFNIPSGSMEGTLLVGDYLFVSKASYGYSRYSFPFGIFPFMGRFFASSPQRGDIVVFKYPIDNSTDYIKRLIGLPGDHIQMKQGTLYINDQAVPQEKTDDFVGPNPCPAGASDQIQNVGDGTVRVPRYVETLPGGVKHEILNCSNEGSLDNTEVFTVPEGHYFMMGDNRDNSADSRADVGYVPFENFVGKSEIIFFSIGCKLYSDPLVPDQRPLCGLTGWPFYIRFNRLGRLTY